MNLFLINRCNYQGKDRQREAMMNKYSSANEVTSVFIPRVFANITKERITHVVENKVPLGKVERVDIVNIDDKFNRVFIHFQYWYDTEFVDVFKRLLNDDTKQAKIVYDEPWYWIVLKNTNRVANGEPKMRIKLDVEPSTPPQSSPKTFVTFTTNQSTKNTKYGVTKWADYESDDDADDFYEDGEIEDDSTPPSPHSPPPHQPPQPPTYPHPYIHNYGIPQPFEIVQHIPYQMPYYFINRPIAPILPIYHIPIAPLLPTFPPPLSRQECCSPPPLYIEPFPVASWNGVSIDESLHQDYESPLTEDDISSEYNILSEHDYQEILLELADECDDVYSDEDLYNMEMLEKEELDLIYPKFETDVKYHEIYDKDSMDSFQCDKGDSSIYPPTSTTSVSIPLTYKDKLLATTFKTLRKK